MARHLNYNPGNDSVEYLEAITCGENRHYILEQLLVSLRAETGRPNHQHHLLIGPRGAGKTHLLRLLAASRIPNDPQLASAYLPLVMPEEIPLRSPGDLFLKFVERLASLLANTPPGIDQNQAREARSLCLNALTTAKGIRDTLERFEVMAAAVDAVAKTLARIVLPIAENMDMIFYLGAQRGRTGTLDEQWALRRHLQETPHVLLIAAAPVLFGAVGDPGKPFYDFFRTHELQELQHDEAIEIIRLRLEHEVDAPGDDILRNERVADILAHFPEKKPYLHGLLVMTGSLPRFIHLLYEVVVGADIEDTLSALNGFLDDMTPYFQHRLDPRCMPPSEIDLLHKLALARGPQQPKELADALCGVGTNEVSELLSRLQERGLVKRSGRPGGQAVTWDLTEPLYRVWTQFRDNPESQDIYRLLGKFVASLYDLDLITRQQHWIDEELPRLPAGNRRADHLQAQKRLLDCACEYIQISGKTTLSSGENTETSHAAEEPEQLEQLQAASRTRPEDAAIRIRLAGELFKALYHAGKNSAWKDFDTRLDELRQLHRAHPDDVEVRITFAKAQINAIYHTIQPGNWGKCQERLSELRTLNRNYPDDATLREALTKGLVNAINLAGEASNGTLCQELLDEFRNLYCAYPNDTALREALGVGLVNTIYYGAKAGDGKQSQKLLDELRDLHRTYPDETALRELLAKGLFNAFNNAAEAGNGTPGQKLLNELRDLRHAYPDEAALREQLAKGLFNAFNNAAEAGNGTPGRKLLNELRDLHHAYPDEAALREQLANGLVNAINRAGETGDGASGQKLLDELRNLHCAYPDDGALREPLSRGLFNAIYFTAGAGNGTLGRKLLDELHDLQCAYPDNAALRKELAHGLFNAFNDAAKGSDGTLGHELLNELRDLHHAYPDDAALCEPLARGLVNAIHYAAKADDGTPSRELLDELLVLAENRLGTLDGDWAAKGILKFGVTLLGLTKTGLENKVRDDASWLEQRLPAELHNAMRPLWLAFELADKGNEEQVLAREPEEMRRTVKLLLEMADKRAQQPASD